MRVDLEEKRRRRIRVVENTLNSAKLAGISINYEKLIKEISSRFSTARRTSQEYIDIAMGFNWKIVNVGNDKELIYKPEPYDQILDKNSKEWTNLSEKDKKAIVEA